mgnify:FL=1
MVIKDGKMYGINESEIKEPLDFTLTSEEWMELTDDLVEIVTKYSKDENWDTPMKKNWGSFAEARDEVVDCIHKIRRES